MKNKILAITIIATFFFCACEAQVAQADFVGITWKVNEYYINSVKYQSGTFDSLRYHFKSGTILEIRPPQAQATVTLTYSFNPSNSVITITDENSSQSFLKVVYADRNNFIFTTSSNDPVTGELLNSEVRMVPE